MTKYPLVVGIIAIVAFLAVGIYYQPESEIVASGHEKYAVCMDSAAKQIAEAEEEGREFRQFPAFKGTITSILFPSGKKYIFICSLEIQNADSPSRFVVVENAEWRVAVY